MLLYVLNCTARTHALAVLAMQSSLLLVEPMSLEGLALRVTCTIQRWLG